MTKRQDIVVTASTGLKKPTLGLLRCVEGVWYVTTGVFGSPVVVDDDNVHLLDTEYAYHHVTTSEICEFVRRLLKGNYQEFAITRYQYNTCVYILYYASSAPDWRLKLYTYNKEGMTKLIYYQGFYAYSVYYMFNTD